MSILHKTPPLKTQIGCCSLINGQQEFVNGLVNGLIDQGLLIPMNNERKYYRTLNQTEMRQWERQNGN